MGIGAAFSSCPHEITTCRYLSVHCVGTRVVNVQSRCEWSHKLHVAGGVQWGHVPSGRNLAVVAGADYHLQNYERLSEHYHRVQPEQGAKDYRPGRDLQTYSAGSPGMWVIMGVWG